MNEGLKQLINNGETGTVEFKRSTASLKSAAQTLCAFLNGDGGTIFIGVTNDKKIIGQNVTDQTKLEIANTLKKFEPTANITVDYLEIDNSRVVIILSAHPDHHCIPYSFNGRAYERRESETQIMTQSRYQQLLLSRNMHPISWESLSTDVPLEDLDANEIVRTMKEGIQNGYIDRRLDTEDSTEILKRFNLLTNGQLTNAAVVLFFKGDMPNNYLQCVLRMARFKGLEKGNFIDSKQVYGNAFYLLREAETFINRNTAIASHLKTGKLAREDYPEYPLDAVREALINAIVHRDYASPGGAITLTIYDNRLEIINTGLLPEGITLNDLKQTHTSHPRNPTMIKVFYRRGLIEAMGMGTQQIVQVCLNSEMKEPEFFEQAGTFVVRLWSRNYIEPAQASVTALSTRQEEILALLKEKPLSPSDILSQLTQEISDRTLRRDLQSLKEKGYINVEGSTWKSKWFLSK